MVADESRAVVVAMLCVVIGSGDIDITVLLVAMFLLGTAEVFADTTSATLLPMLVEKPDLGIGNARFQASFIVANQIVGAPVGAFLFAAVSASYGGVERHAALATIMRVCLLLEVLMHLGLALTTSGTVAIAIMFVFGVYAFSWGPVSQTVPQRMVPTELQGRVGSVYLVTLVGGLVIEQGLGGAIAETWGLTAPFWFAFVGTGITLALVRRQLGHLAHGPPG